MLAAKAHHGSPPIPKGAVSVVIPTRDRPDLVAHAVRSALEQSYAPVEVLVVLDGPESGADGGTSAALRAFGDPRVRLIPLAARVGGAEARNHGVRMARGDWIAFLDDDDVWFADKLAVQLAFAATLQPGISPILSCRVVARAPGWEAVWPRVPYQTGQPISEYLFCRRGWAYGEALLQTSTLVAPRSLLERVPFTPGLAKHQDWDWLMRAGGESDVAVYSVGEAPLAVFHIEGGRASVSRAADWRASLRWALERRTLFSRRALRHFVATECAAQAGRQSGSDKRQALARLLSLGVPSPAALLRAVVFLYVPQGKRRLLRGWPRQLRESLRGF
jgi:glycosyltransferase involved in cell wall biosynthesis